MLTGMFVVLLATAVGWVLVRMGKVQMAPPEAAGDRWSGCTMGSRHTPQTSTSSTNFASAASTKTCRVVVNTGQEAVLMEKRMGEIAVTAVIAKVKSVSMSSWRVAVVAAAVAIVVVIMNGAMLADRVAVETQAGYILDSQGTP